MTRNVMKVDNSLLILMLKTKSFPTVNNKIHHQKKRKKWRLSWLGKVPKNELILALRSIQRDMKIKHSYHRKMRQQTNRQLLLLLSRPLQQQHQAKRRNLMLIWGSSTTQRNTKIHHSFLNKNSQNSSNNNRNLYRRKDQQNPSLTSVLNTMRASMTIKRFFHNQVLSKASYNRPTRLQSKNQAQHLDAEQLYTSPVSR